MESAKKFYKDWVSKEKGKRLSDPLKGAEEVGRGLAKSECVKWVERWPFSQELIDLNCYEGLFREKQEL